MKKSEIRKKILKIRKKKYSRSLVINYKLINKILLKKNFKKKIIGGYYPYNYEADAMKVLENFEKRKYVISLPKIKSKSQMDFFQWSVKDPLIINDYGIPEPTSNKIIYPDILLVPLVAFDQNFNRLGYGGGFYDRYIKRIKKIKNIITIGLAFSFQKVKEIPIDKYDVKLDFIITEKEK